MNILKTFIDDDSGAVTVDWVVLTAAVIGLGAAVSASVGAGITDLAGDISSNLSGTEIASYLPAAPYVVSLPRPGRVEIPAFCPKPTAENPKPECSPAQVVITAQLGMSDGTTWHKVTTTVEGQDPVTVYTDADGNVVDAPDVQDGASDSN